MARDETVQCRLTVCFEEPFWIGLYERQSGGRYEVCRITFGAEPADAEVHGFLLENAYRLTFSPAMSAEMPVNRSVSPKRMQREARRQMASTVVGTKAQQALALRREQAAQERKACRKERNEAEAQRRYDLRQEKRREKRKGH